MKQSPTKQSKYIGPSRKKGAAREVYGFVGWTTSFVVYAAFILWAFLPDSWLHSMGITYYPDRYWAISLPTYIIVAVGFGLVVYFCLNLISIAPLSSRETITDRHTRIDKELGALYDDIPPIADIPISTVSELLYLDGELSREEPKKPK